MFANHREFKARINGKYILLRNSGYLTLMNEYTIFMIRLIKVSRDMKFMPFVEATQIEVVLRKPSLGDNDEEQSDQ
jgi:hypothetical protein